MIVGKFNKDFFVILDNYEDTTGHIPRVAVTEGKEDCVYINGQSLRSVISDEPIKMIDWIDVSTGIKVRVSSNSTLDASVVSVDSKSHPRPAPVHDGHIAQVVYYDIKDTLRPHRITPTYSTKTSRDVPSGSYYDSSLNNILKGDELPDRYRVLRGNLYHIHIESDEEVYVNLMEYDEYNNLIDENPFKSIGESQENINKYINYKQTKKMVGEDVSYCLLRANPKLTGNIKVVVDSDSNLYLDTFKVSNALSQSKYRRIKVNPDEYYGRSVMSKFKGMPSDDLYKIEESCYKLFSTANNLGEEYYDKYNYGVRTNSDKLYPENFSFLAPLCIKRVIPDFFVIFKVKDYESIPDKTRMSYFLKNGEIVKVYDMRKDSPVGKYVRKIQEHASGFTGDIFVSYDYDKTNLYNGISLDRGIVTSVHESTSFERNIKNQVAMNDWYTLGFERNRLLSKDIINFEFMFNDTDEKLFSLNTYFGLYIRLNGEDEDFTCIGIKPDGTPIFDSSISGGNFDASVWGSTIYGLSTPETFVRIKKGNIQNTTDSSLLKDFVLTPYRNIVSPETIPYPEEYSNRCYASVKMYDVLEPGEHYRIVDKKNKKIFEVIASDVTNENFDVSEVNYSHDSSTEYDIQSISIYNCEHRIDIDDASVDSIIDEQLPLIQQAFNSFDSDKIVSYYGDKSFSVIYDEQFTYNPDTCIIFEKVSCYHAITDNEKEVLVDIEDHSSLLLGEDDIESIIVNPEDPETFKRILYPYGFEVLGQRKVYCALFVQLTNTAYLIKTDVTESLNKFKTVMYRSLNENKYSIYHGFNVYTLKPDGTLKPKHAKDIPGFGNESSYIIELEDSPVIINGKMFFYSNTPLNAGVCSIFNIKDFDFDVLDNVNTIWASGKTVDGATPGRYVENNNIAKKYIKTGTEERITSYLDSYERYASAEYNNGDVVDFTKDVLDESTAATFLSIMSNNDHKSSDISLISPYCCKWKHNGTDYVGLPLRVMYDLSTLNANSSYFIAMDSSGYIGGIASDLNSEIYGEKCVGEILSNKKTSVISNNMFFGDGKIDDLITEDAVKYMAEVESFGENGIIFTYGGIRLRITSNNKNVIDLSRYVNYKAIIIACEQNNPKITKGCDLLFDEVNERIVILYYCGTDDIVYNEYNADTSIYQGDLCYRLKECYRIQRNSPLMNCFVDFPESVQTLFIPDDASYYDKAQLFSNEADWCYIFLTSAVADASSYTLEKYNLIIGSLNNCFPYNELQPNYFYALDGSIYSDSVALPIDNYAIATELKKKYETVDGFIIWSYGDHFGDDLNISFFNKVPMTPELIKLEEMLKSPAVYVKTHNNNVNYTNVNGLLDIRVLEPITFQKENSDFESTENVGLVYPSCASPLMKDMLVFDNESDDSDNLGSLFGKNFDNTNVLIDGHNNISQMWLRKYAAEKLTLDETNDEEQTLEYHTKYVKMIPLSGLSMPLNVGDVITQEFESGDTSTYIIETVSMSERNGCYFNTEVLEWGLLYMVIDSSATDLIAEAEAYRSGTGDAPDFSRKLIVINTDKELGYYNSGRIIKNDSISVSIKTVNGNDVYVISGIFYTTMPVTREAIQEILIYDEITGQLLLKMDYNGSGSPPYRGIAGMLWEYKYQSTDGNNDFMSVRVSPITSKNFNGFNYDTSVIDPRSIYDAGWDRSDAALVTCYGQPFYIMSDSDSHPDSTSTVTWTSLTNILHKTVAIDVISNISPLSNCWESNVYRTYKDFDSYTSELGITTGYEPNNFIASRGLNLYGQDGGKVIKTITIDSWFNSRIDSSNKKITLDITSSLINKILFMEGYSENWENKNIDDVKNKSLYIENSILKYISIDEKCKVTIYKVNNTNSLSIIDIASYDNLYEAQNTHNVLIKDGDRYYIELDNLDNSGYAVKFDIEL